MQQIAAVVITYQPDENVSDRLQRIARQVHWLIIVDNASTPVAIEGLEAFTHENASRHLICNSTNKGIAAALNQGIMLASELGANWVLTMDQDTLVNPKLVDELAAIAQQYEHKDKLALVAANFIDSTGKTFAHNDVKSDSYYESRTAITSGTLLNIAVWKKLKGYREDFFIDSVDHDYCFRARQAGMIILQGLMPLMHHKLGDTHKRVWLLGLHPAVANYSPLRRYYMTRNRIAMFKSHWRHETVWVMKELVMIFADALLITLYERGRPAKITAMAKGMLHGVFGKMGSNSPRHAATSTNR